MEQPSSPSGVSEWFRFLKDKPLPVLARTVEQLNARFKNPDISLRDLVPVIVRDPVVCFHLIREANSLNKNADTQANSVELAVATLGLDRIQALVTALPVIRINHASVPHKQYFHAVDNSYHAAVQARFLCRFPGQSVINDTGIAALFYGIGHWAMWRYAPQRMSEVKIGIYEQHKDVVLAENDVLGCTIQQISEALVQEWKLSDLAVQALQHRTSPDAEMLDQLHRHARGDDSLDDEQIKEVKRLLNASFYPVKLANWLALTVPYGWEKEKAQRLLEIINDFLNGDESETASSLHRNCVDASRGQHIDGIMSPAALMLLLPSDRILSYRLDGKKPATAGSGVPARRTPAAAPRQQPLPATATTRSEAAPVAKKIEDEFRDKDKFLQLANKMLKQPGDYEDNQAVFADLIRGLRIGLGLQRLSLFRVDDGGQLLPLLHSGFTEKDPIRRLTLNLEVPSLFKKLSHKPVAVWMSDHNRDQIRAELPERFKACSNQHSFLLMSLFRGQQPIAYIYADHGPGYTPVSQFYFKYFKYLCGAVNLCLSKRTSE